LVKSWLTHSISNKSMKITLKDLDLEDLELQRFEKSQSKKRRLKSKQSVRQLILADEENESDPDLKFKNSDLNEFCLVGLLDELISVIKTGKEASVYLGRNSDGFVAVKVYTDLRVRSFRRDNPYREGRFIGNSRIEKAIDQGSQHGLDAHQILWVQEEFRQMTYLHRHGIRVPKPIAVNGLAILMEFIGDENGTPAPRIADAKMERAEAQEAFRQSVQNLQRIVSLGKVHGDYSTFNILWHDERAVVIDFPQIIEFENNPNANAFLERDIHSLCKSFRKQGIIADEAQVFREVRKFSLTE
jgi:RIO kinase 1